MQFSPTIPLDSPTGRSSTPSMKRGVKAIYGHLKDFAEIRGDHGVTAQAK